ncbi:metal ABC transporter solute-binding protein, Zn/Mn family [Halobacillus mangrovi]|uniref:Adhesin n=1 Tax=Halobacillus mangrovi TaxID=402384 RepID=A0A1W5ZYR3_9BACI|nr:zinc ABC transporter substrate-binding protein [Halobacillus mangrovi]ARI78367.1 adhesin [Halobacillus mangrovi]
MKKYIALISIFLITSILTACGSEQTSQEGDASSGNDHQLKIHTTVYPLKYFTEQIAGDAVEVDSILPPGSDPHTYEPTTKEMVKMADADAFIYSGAGLEGYAETISEAIQPEGVAILEASQGIQLEEHVHEHSGEEHAGEEQEHHEGEAKEEDHEGHNHGEQDPHIWLDPIRSVQLAENIKDQLVELKPEQKEQFNKNFEQLKKKLETLDEEFHKQLESKPKSKIIVSHAAYGYWEQAYGIEQVPISGLSATSEPSQKELEEIIKKAEEHEISHVLFEQNVTPKVSKVVQKEIGAEALRVHNLSVLTEEDIKNKEGYFTLMRENLEVLSEALSE